MPSLPPLPSEGGRNGRKKQTRGENWQLNANDTAPALNQMLPVRVYLKLSVGLVGVCVCVCVTVIRSEGPHRPFLLIPGTINKGQKVTQRGEGEDVGNGYNLEGGRGDSKRKGRMGAKGTKKKG
jgi:hypothetical protein